jgi:hypothetical protein
MHNNSSPQSWPVKFLFSTVVTCDERGTGCGENCLTIIVIGSRSVNLEVNQGRRKKEKYKESLKRLNLSNLLAG